MDAIKIIGGLDWGKRAMVFYRENWNYWINPGELLRVKAFLENRCNYLFDDVDTVVEAIGIRVPDGVERDKFTLWNGNDRICYVYTTIVYRHKDDGWVKYNGHTLEEYITELDKYSVDNKKYEWVLLGE